MGGRSQANLMAASKLLTEPLAFGRTPHHAEGHCTSRGVGGDLHPKTPPLVLATIQVWNSLTGYLVPHLHFSKIQSGHPLSIELPAAALFTE